MRLTAIKVLVWICLGGMYAFGVENDALDVERQAVANRLKIKSWHVGIDSAVEYFNPEENQMSETIKYVYYADNAKRRRDMTRLKSSPQDVLANQVVTKEIWADYYYYFCDETYIPPASSNEMVQPEMVREFAKIDNTVVPPIDVRLIGFSSTGLVFDKNVTDTLGNTNPSLKAGDADAIHKTIEDELLEGIACKKTVWQLSKNRSVTTWIVPTMGFAPICMEFQDSNGLCKTRVCLAQYKGTDLWFPISSVFEEYNEGKLVLKETLNITVFSLNENLDESVFALKGLTIPTGWPVTYLDKAEDNYVWNGQEIVTEREAAYGHLLKNKHYFGVTKTLLMIFGLLLITLACFWNFFNCFLSKPLGCACPGSLCESTESSTETENENIP